MNREWEQARQKILDGDLTSEEVRAGETQRGAKSNHPNRKEAAQAAPKKAAPRARA